ncbi:MAG TPA: chemotaxis protein CheW [Halothiobacillus sp.]|nr:chemotaxis protein CheW [Halothiobacillus sp.]
MSNLDQAEQGQPDQSDARSAVVPYSGARVRIVRLPTQVANLEVIVPYGLIAEINEVMLPEGETHLSRLDAAMVDWRAQRIPLVSLEAMLNEPLPTIGQRVRCAVLYGTNPDIALPYYAILLSGVPRSEEVTGESFSEENLGDGGIWGMTALLGDRRIAIPDVRSLELRIDEMRLRFEQESAPTP